MSSALGTTMAIVNDPPPNQGDPALLPERPKSQNWFIRTFRSKRLLNRLAVGALEAADIVLGSIPAAEVAAEIKDVALLAIKD
jgi:hypothetical protein